MRFHRGMAILLLVFGLLYLIMGRWASVGQGEPSSSYEALRRYDAALRVSQSETALNLGETALAMAREDGRWTTTQLALLESHLSDTYLATGATDRALELAESADERVLYQASGDISVLINMATKRAELALDLGRPFEAACTWGLVIERLGPDRVADPHLRARPHPDVEWLSHRLVDDSAKFVAADDAAGAGDTVDDADYPLTSCQLLSDFYAARDDLEAAGAVNDMVVSAARKPGALRPSLRTALLYHAAEICERRGDVALAELRLREAIEVMEATGNTQALLVALDRLSTFLSRWGDAERALPILERSIGIRETLNGPQHKALVNPLMALGYAHLDTGDVTGAEAAFRRALAIAQSDHGRNPPAALETLLALQEIYQETGKSADLRKTEKAIAALNASGVIQNGPQDPPYADPPAATQPALVLDIPFAATGRPAGGRAALAFGPPATRLTLGTVEVALPAAGPQASAWAALWPADSFEETSDAYAGAMVSPPVVGDWHLTPPAGLVLYVPGQSTPFDKALSNAAMLQAAMGPDFTVIAADWPDGGSVRGLLRNPQEERAAIAHLKDTLTAVTGGLAAGTGTPDRSLIMIAEGRGAYLLDKALARVGGTQRQDLLSHLNRVVLISPDINRATLKDWSKQAESAEAKLLTYGNAKALELVVSSEVYGGEVLGLHGDRMAQMGFGETVVLAADPEAPPGGSLVSHALAADIAAALRDRLPAKDRCGLDADPSASGLWTLRSTGCAASAGG